jgi:hypothetical protein
MKKGFTLLMLFVSVRSLAQRTEVIKLDNAKVNFTVELGVFGAPSTLDGNAKFYNVWYNQGGYQQTFPNYNAFIPIHASASLEYHLLKKPGALAFGIGLGYNYGLSSPTYVAQNESNGIFTKNPMTDSIATIHQSFVEVPIYLKLRLGKIPFLGESLFLKAGVKIEYLMNAELQPITLKADYFGTTEIINPSITRKYSVTEAFNKINYHPYFGLQYRGIGLFYLGIDFGLASSKILNNSYANYSSTPANFSLSYASGSIGYCFR